MLDYSAGEISSVEAAVLINEFARLPGIDSLKFYPGVSYRHLAVWESGPLPDHFRLTPPHDISGREIAEFLPAGEKGAFILSIMERSSFFLNGHSLNKERREKGLKPANSLWLWGQGKKPRFDAFRDKYGLEGAIISAVDLLKGLGRCASLEVIEVPGATGTLHTNYSGKVSAALESLQHGLDFVFLHIEAPDEAGHRGEVETKIEAIEKLDAKIVGEMLRGLESLADYKLLALSDHPTPLSLRTHTRESVPFCIYRKGEPVRHPERSFSEKAAAAGLNFDPGWKLMKYFLTK